MSMKAETKLIAIVGGSGSGKTWLTSRLSQALAVPTARVSLDDFYFPRSDLSPAIRAKSNFDHPASVDWPLVSEVLQKCRSERTVELPSYDFVSHTCRPRRQTIHPAPLVLVEGLWLFWLPEVRGLFDLKLYIECPVQLRLHRRLERDVKERGRTPRSVRAQFWETVVPMHERFVAPQRRWADLVLGPSSDRMELRRLAARLESLVPKAEPAPGTAKPRSAEAVVTN